MLSEGHARGTAHMRNRSKQAVTIVTTVELRDTNSALWLKTVFISVQSPTHKTNRINVR